LLGWRVQGYRLRTCAACKLEFLSPQPDDSVLSAIYVDGYFLGEQSHDAAGRRSQMKRATAALYCGILARHVKPENTNLLEIGCGQGEALLEAKDRGFRVAGVEISAHAAAAANQLLGERAVGVGTLESIPLEQQRFGVVLAADLIEHVRDPEGWLLQVRNLLLPGGVLLLVTPSLDSWSRRLLRSHWMEYKVEHLYYFSAASLGRLLRRCGFEPMEVTASRKVLTLDYVARHFERFRVPVLSPLISWAGRVLPGPLAHRRLRIPAGGLMAIARKPGSTPSL
jgi:2-polyprenyl-3-methyl-5-hydroxy-6-metoxy-1,4-benzoquinol methylase